MKQTHAEEFRTSFPWCGTKMPNVDVTKAWAPSGTFSRFGFRESTRKRVLNLWHREPKISSETLARTLSIILSS